MAAANGGFVWLTAAVLALGCASSDAHRAEAQHASPASSASAPAATSITVAHFAIEIPRGYQARDVSPPMMDFDLYRVERQGSTEGGCSLYFGNAPDFPQLRWSQNARKMKADGRSTTAFERRGAVEGVIKFSGLTYKQSTAGSPWTSIHYLCDGLDELGMKDALGMIASIKVVQPHVE